MDTPITGRQIFEEAGLRSHWITENHGSPMDMWRECPSVAALTVVALRYGAPVAIVVLALSECADAISDDTRCHAALTQEIHDWLTSEQDIAIDVSHERPINNCCMAMSQLLIMAMHGERGCPQFMRAMLTTLGALGDDPKLVNVFRRLVPISCFAVPKFGS